MFCLNISTKDGQRCVDIVNVQQPGSDRLNVDSEVVTSMAFSCYGKLAGYLVSLNKDNNGYDYPHITLWHVDSGDYYLQSDYEIAEYDIIQMSNYYFVNVSVPKTETIRIWPGDLVGYYQPKRPRYTVWSINTIGYTSYNVSASHSGYYYALNTVDDRQPLIQLLYGT